MRQILNATFTEKQYILLLHFSIVVVSFLLGIFILTDVRLNVLGESHGGNLSALSIAISRLVYGVEGMVGLEQVLNILNGIPSVSTINLDDSAAIELYHLLINDKVHQATLLNNVDVNRLHGYWNDLGYLFYIISAFSLFGIKINSLSCLWLLIFNASVIFYLISYRKNILYLFILWALIIALSIIVISNPGVGAQLITIYNNRFITILGIIPLFHCVNSMIVKKKELIGWVCLIGQAAILAFIVLSRGTAQWMLIAIIFCFLYSFWKQKSSGLKNKSHVSMQDIIRFVSPLIIVSIFVIIVKTTIFSPLHEEYENPLWNRYHVVWHPIFIGMTIDPILYEKYVCSEKPLKDRLKGFRPLVCEEKNNRFVRPRLYYGVFGQPSDMHGYHAAVRYLREHGSNEQIGMDIKNTDYFNLAWARYDQVLQKVFINMILESPIDSLYVIIITKPLKFLKETFLYGKYFFEGIAGSNKKIGVLFLCFIIVSYYYLFLGFKNWVLNDEEKLFIKQNYETYFLIIFISSLIQSIVFYSQPHTIADSVSVLLAFFFFFPVMIVKYFHRKQNDD